MRFLIVLLALGGTPSLALASDPTGLLYVGALQLLLLAWPLVLPLFYLRPQKNKLYSYFLFVILGYGSLGILALPQSLVTNFGAWFPSENPSYEWIVPLILAQHAAAFLFCLWYLPRFRKLLRLDQAT